MGKELTDLPFRHRIAAYVVGTRLQNPYNTRALVSGAAVTGVVRPALRRRSRTTPGSTGGSGRDGAERQPSIAHQRTWPVMGRYRRKATALDFSPTPSRTPLAEECLQLRHPCFRCPAGSSLPFGASSGGFGARFCIATRGGFLPARGIRLAVAEKHPARRRITEAHLSALHAQLEPQRLAGQGQRAVR